MTITRFLDPKNDVAFKKIFGTERNKDILIHFLNDILEFQGDSRIEHVEFLSPVQDPDIASKKQSVVDVLCRDKNGVQYIVEMQVAPFKGFEKRAQYYAAKAYCRQADRGPDGTGHYGNLKEIIFIAIMDTIVFPNKTGYKSDHVILDKQSLEHDLKDFYFTFIELPKFNKTDINDLNNMIEKWCYFFKYAEETSPNDFEKIAASNEVIEKAYDALCAFNWTEAELIAYEQEIKRVYDQQAIMAAGLEIAEAKGMQRGMEKGMEKAKLEVAELCLARGLDLETIAAVTALPVADIKRLQENLARKS